MMDIRNCERCGKAYVKNAPLQVLCPRCIALEDEEFEKVKEYLRKHPGTSVDDLAKELDIPAETIVRFMESGRLEVKGGSGLSCRSCGKPIEKGTMCADCQNSLLRDLQSVGGTANQRAETPQNPDTSRTRGAHYHTKK